MGLPCLPGVFTGFGSQVYSSHKKSHDYAPSNDPAANYRFAGLLANLFSHSPLDAGFIGRLGEKIMRLSVLETGGLQPKNESIADTERDIAVIATLWMAARKDSRGRNMQVEAPSERVKTVSEEASCKIIELTESLSDVHLRDMMSYLMEVNIARSSNRDVLKSKETKKI